jgi:hypothetical protein
MRRSDLHYAMGQRSKLEPFPFQDSVRFADDDTRLPECLDFFHVNEEGASSMGHVPGIELKWRHLTAGKYVGNDVSQEEVEGRYCAVAAVVDLCDAHSSPKM